MPSESRQNASSSNARLAWTLGVSGTASEHRRLGGRFDGADEAFARTMDASTLHRRRTSNVKSSWHGKAFLVEALVLLGQRYGVELPICQAVHRVLYCGADPMQELRALLDRNLTREFGE